MSVSSVNMHSSLNNTAGLNSKQNQSVKKNQNPTSFGMLGLPDNLTGPEIAGLSAFGLAVVGFLALAIRFAAKNRMKMPKLPIIDKFGG